MGYLGVCSHHLDGATLFGDQDDPDDPADDLGSWTAPNRITAFASWTLASPPSGWQTGTPLTRLLPGKSYTLYGWTADDSSSAIGVTFTLEQLMNLTPDHVMHWSGTDPQGDVYKIDSVEEFRRSACVDR